MAWHDLWKLLPPKSPNSCGGPSGALNTLLLMQRPHPSFCITVANHALCAPLPCLPFSGAPQVSQGRSRLQARGDDGAQVAMASSQQRWRCTMPRSLWGSGPQWATLPRYIKSGTTPKATSRSPPPSHPCLAAGMASSSCSWTNGSKKTWQPQGELLMSFCSAASTSKQFVHDQVSH